MNFVRPKLLMSLLLAALLGFVAMEASAQDLGVSAINVRSNAQTGNHPILMGTGNNSIDVVITNYDAVVGGSATFTVDLEVSWPNQVGGPLVLTQNYMGSSTFSPGESVTITYTGDWHNTNGFNFDRRIIYTLDARVYNITGGDVNSSNDRLSDHLMPREVAPAFQQPRVKVDYRGGAGIDFTNLTYVGEYLSASGLVNDLEVSINSGTYSMTHSTPSSATMSLDGSSFSTDNMYTVTFSGSKNYPQNVIIRGSARERDLGDAWFWKIKDINTKIQYLTFQLEPTTDYNEGGRVLDFENTQAFNEQGSDVNLQSQEVYYNVFEGYTTPEENSSTFSTVYCDGNYLKSFKFNKNKVTGGWRCFQMDNDMYSDPSGITLEVMNNEFNDFTNGGVYVERPAVTKPAGYQGGTFSGNTFMTSSMDGDALYISNLSHVTNNNFYLTGTAASGEYAITVVHDPAYETIAYIDNNNIMDNPDGTPVSSQIGGIMVVNAKQSYIRNNNITIDNAGTDFGIMVIGGGTDLITYFAHVQKNTINMTTLGNGMSFSGGYYKAYYNAVNVQGTNTPMGTGAYGVLTSGCTGILAMNKILANYADGVLSSGSIDQYFYYNTIVVTGAADNTKTAVLLSNGDNTLKRNMLVNMGTNAASYAIFVSDPYTGNLVLDENNYWSGGANFGNIGSSAIALLGDWQTATQALATTNDVGSTNAPVILNENGDYLYEYFDNDEDPNNGGPYAGIYYTTALFANDDPLHNEFEINDFYGNERIGWYAGVVNLEPVVTINTQPLDILSCQGEDHLLQCIADASLNSHPVYQWYKDDVAIPGATNAGLNLNNLDWQSAGKYYCMIGDMGGGTPVKSHEVLVVVVGKTEITRQPAPQTGSLHGSVTFEVELHTRGFENNPDDPLYPFNELLQPEIQWYVLDNGVGVPLENTPDQDYNIIAGAKSNILTISNLNEDSWTTPIQVYARVRGYCDFEYDLLNNKVWNWVYSDTVGISQPPSIESVDVALTNGTEYCEGESVEMTATANTTGEIESMEYQWMKDGANIMDATNDVYTIENVKKSDIGDYTCMVTIYPGELSATSATLTFDVKEKPVISSQSEDMDVKEGDPFTLEVTANGYEPLSYQWSKDGTEIDGATSSTYTVDPSTKDDGGSYLCMVSNDCGDVTSSPINVTITDGGEPNDVPEAVAGGFVLFGNIPNPFTETTNITFSTPYATNVKLVITDIFGREKAVLFNGTVDGPQTVEVNSTNLRLAAGVYYYTLIADGQKLTKRMVLVK